MNHRVISHDSGVEMAKAMLKHQGKSEKNKQRSVAHILYLRYLLPVPAAPGEEVLQNGQPAWTTIWSSDGNQRNAGRCGNAGERHHEILRELVCWKRPLQPQITSPIDRSEGHIRDTHPRSGACRHKIPRGVPCSNQKSAEQGALALAVVIYMPNHCISFRIMIPWKFALLHQATQPICLFDIIAV